MMERWRTSVLKAHLTEQGLQTAYIGADRSSLKVESGFPNRIDVECEREVKDDPISLLSIYKDGAAIR